MPQSLSKLFVHIIFHIKNQKKPIGKEVRPDLYAYMGRVIKDNDSIPIIINGTHDHVHVLCVMSKTITVAKLTEEIKRHSSRWIKTQGNQYIGFAWQGGYAAFSVSPSLDDRTRDYIMNQENHHKKMTFKEELVLFLKEYGIDYNEKYLWDDD